MRLRPLTETISKALLEIHERPFIAWQLDGCAIRGLTFTTRCSFIVM
jgi:NDP-sugar pyrophosphorylase family protein